MSTSKKIKVNFSSLVGLRAELLRKQIEVKAAKLHAEKYPHIPLSELTRKTKRPKKEEKKPKEKDLEDVRAHKRSKLMLNAKARLYERLRKSKNGTRLKAKNYLVDFEKKCKESEEDVRPQKTEEEVEPEDAWVEYEDCFGRTRKCLRKDLEIMREKDELVKRQIMEKKVNEEEDNKDKNSGVPEIEKEPEIEIMRRKWEEQTQKLAEKDNIHYQDILFDEARNHGIGYYAFSQDEEERTKQQENLFVLRKETEQKQKEMKELKELRDKMETNRLKAARIRQRIRAGLPIEPSEDELKQENLEENTDSINNCNEEAIDNSSVKKDKDEASESMEKETVDDSKIEEDKIRAFEEILDKRPQWRQMSQEEWVYARRQERNTEFAPSYSNFKSSGFLHNTKYNPTNTDKNYSQNCPSNLNQSEDTFDDDSEIIGPLPPAESFHKDNVDNCNINKHIDQSKETENPEIDNKINTSDLLNSNDQNSTVSHGKMNEENIAAGLKYLREKFEESHNE